MKNTNDTDISKPARERRRQPKYAKSVLHLNLLLAQAGYDPDKIPEENRLSALHMAWAFECGLFDIDDVAQACDLTFDEACDTRDAMRFAARPGTIVG